VWRRTASILTVLTLGALAVGGLVVPGGGAAADTGAAIAGRAGFAEGYTLLWGSDTELNQRLDGIAATGATWLRVDFDWSVAQPSASSWNWGPIDRVVNAARARGLRVLALLTYTPVWARPPGTSDKNPPTNVADFATFARAAVQRYQPKGVAHWEIWNEPNSKWFWSPKPSPSAYTALLRSASTAIKGVDPGATVITGGLSPAPDAADGTMVAPLTFLQGIYAAGGRASFDAVAHHPYNYPYMPMRSESYYNWNAFAGVTPALHDTMVANGDGAKKIWGTEMGAPTVDGSTPEYVAAYVTEAYTAWSQWSYTGPLFWYSYRDAGTDPADIESNFGLVTQTFAPKEPALQAFVSVLTQPDPNGSGGTAPAPTTTAPAPTTTAPAPTTTAPAPTATADTAAPVITVGNPVVNGRKVRVRWSTNEPATSVVEYWISGTTQVKRAEVAGLVTNHVIELTNLTRRTVYAYRIRSTDAAGNEAVSAVLTFQTIS
jgi:hypothetical protein